MIQIRLLLLAALLLLAVVPVRAQGIPQYIVANPSAVPQQGDTFLYNVGVFGMHDCADHRRQWSLDPAKFFPALPRQGTITAIYFRLPGSDLGAWPLDTVIANSPIIGARIKMAVTNLDTLYSPDSCRRVKPVTVFHTPVFRVPVALQGKDPANCWWKMPLDVPFSYNLDARLHEDDTTTRRYLVLEASQDSSHPYMGYDPAKGTSDFAMRYYLARNAYGRFLQEVVPSPCHSGGGACGTDYHYHLPVLGFDFAPNSVPASPAPSSSGGVYPNPVGTEGKLYFKSGLQGRSYRLYSLSGSLVAAGTATSAGVDMQALPRGMYLLHCGTQRYKVVR